MKNYVEENITQTSQTTLKYAMKMLANSSESVIFLFLGVCTVTDTHDWNTMFVILTIVFALVFRALGNYKSSQCLITVCVMTEMRKAMLLIRLLIIRRDLVYRDC